LESAYVGEAIDGANLLRTRSLSGHVGRWWFRPDGQ
jgi:hypothetical protein